MEPKVALAFVISEMEVRALATLSLTVAPSSYIWCTGLSRDQAMLHLWQGLETMRYKPGEKMQPQRFAIYLFAGIEAFRHIYAIYHSMCLTYFKMDYIVLICSELSVAFGN